MKAILHTSSLKANFNHYNQVLLVNPFKTLKGLVDFVSC